MTENTKYVPLTEDDLDGIEVSPAKFWYDDGENVYPRRFIRVGNRIITANQARQLKEEINRELGKFQ